MTWKHRGYKHDDKYQRFRLSKGFNHKQSKDDFVLVEYEKRPDVEIENIQQIRAVWGDDKWMLHVICEHEVEPEETGYGTVGIDLGIDNFVALSFSDGETQLYPANKLKEDEYYFSKKIAECDDPSSAKANRLHHKRSKRREHFLHALSKHIVDECRRRCVGTIAVGNLGGIRENKDRTQAKNSGSEGTQVAWMGV